MVDDLEPEEYPSVYRLFPLPHVVFFPHAVLPLHIFEPRYRQMTEDALAAGDKLITIVQLRGDQPGPGIGDPAVAEIACLGKILQHQRLPDGRFNFLLLGLARVKLTREVASEKLYRLAEAEVLADIEGKVADERIGHELLDMFRDLVGRDRPLDPDLNALLEMSVPLGVLTDLVAHALGVEAEVKQALLDETHVLRRAGMLRKILARLLAKGGGKPGERPLFPPPFSAN
jgi:uncharacterized protein